MHGKYEAEIRFPAKFKRIAPILFPNLILSDNPKQERLSRKRSLISEDQMKAVQRESKVAKNDFNRCKTSDGPNQSVPNER